MPTKTQKTTTFVNSTMMVENGGKYTRDWYVIDAANQTLGRVCSQIAKMLIGKNKPHYTPHFDTGDFVIVVNAEKIHMTGKKWSDKIYYHHTGYPGGLKSATASELLKKKPTQLIEHAVKKMMPKNSLGRQQLLKLKVYEGSEHPHAAQTPTKLELFPSSK